MKTLVVSLFMAMACSVAYGEDPAIAEINSKMVKVRSLTADVEIVVRKRAIAFTLNGKLSYEREKNFRLTNYSVVDGKFMSDLGSNDKYFWCYARRINPTTMVYSSWKNLGKTNLKDSMNPGLMMDSLGLQIDTQGATIQKQGDKLVVFKLKPGTRSPQVIRAIVIDPEKPAVTGSYLYSANKKFLGGADITSFYTTNNKMFVPKTMEIKSPSDDATVSWTFSNFKFNVNIPADTFKMPNLGTGVQTVDIGTGEQVRNVND